MPQLGVHLGVGIIAAIINATVGALLLLLVLDLRSRRRPLGRLVGRALGLAPLALSSPLASGTWRHLSRTGCLCRSEDIGRLVVSPWPELLPIS